jgi:hypothetical protein
MAENIRSIWISVIMVITWCFRHGALYQPLENFTQRNLSRGITSCKNIGTERHPYVFLYVFAYGESVGAVVLSWKKSLTNKKLCVTSTILYRVRGTEP